MMSMKVKLTFSEPLLGTLSGNKEIAREFISSKHPDGIQEDEEQSLDFVGGIEEEIEKKSTIFPRTAEGVPFLWDYQLKGFFKDAASMLRRVPKTLSAGVKAYKKIIDGLIFPKPRKIMIHMSGDPTWTERPLRAPTAQGERVALVRSETIPAGSFIEFEIYLLDDKLRPLIKEWLEYGELRGLGQWRNSGMGRFSCEVL